MQVPPAQPPGHEHLGILSRTTGTGTRTRTLQTRGGAFGPLSPEPALDAQMPVTRRPSLPPTPPSLPFATFSLRSLRLQEPGFQDTPPHAPTEPFWIPAPRDSRAQGWGPTSGPAPRGLQLPGPLRRLWLQGAPTVCGRCWPGTPGPQQPEAEGISALWVHAGVHLQRSREGRGHPQLSQEGTEAQEAGSDCPRQLPVASRD